MSSSCKLGLIGDEPSSCKLDLIGDEPSNCKLGLIGDEPSSCKLDLTLRCTVKPALSGHSKRTPKIGFQYRLWLNAGQNAPRGAFCNTLDLH